MNKKILVLLFAGLLLVSTATACGKKGTEVEGSGHESDTILDPFSHETMIIIGTDTNGEYVTRPYEPVTEPDNTSEENPVFTDVNKTVYIWTGVATVRTDTVISDQTGCAWPKEGTTFTATGESKNWYRINYGGKVCYISKNVVCDASLLEGFTEVNETVEIAKNVNVRSVPSLELNNIRGVLNKGDKVKRIGVKNGWSMIEYELVSETEKDENGQPKKTLKHYFISNDCIVSAAETTAQ